MAASAVGLLVGASIGAACLGGHLAHEGSAPKDAARLMMATRDGKVDMAALDAVGTVDQSALNIAMRFSQYAGTGTENSLLAQNLTAMRTSEDARNQRDLPDAKLVLASNMTLASPFSAPVNAPAVAAPSVRAAAAMKFKSANRSDSDCLTQAVYYEARGEGVEGMRAVAQVILNRVRHPAYPKSICGVVYQGAYQRTSCQFSFVCNGAMGAPVESWAWRRAKSVADAALGGYVMAAVGTSTSFHTTGVKPGWGGTMDKVAQIGSHIFYQFRGRGSRLANSTDGVRPSSGVPQISAPVNAAPAAPALDTQTVAMLNAQSKAAALAAKPNAARPVQVSAQIHGKSAHDIIAEVTSAKAPAVSAPVDTAKGIAQ
ncbi:cell wall hydrolase [Asticcacaulis sp.]|uniref:cell wall hydrolase n=1 Tax=Asticcacaulis sp. TaxID=1872648 RepID=UPI002D00F267|nr:cell wall hydrolase [Asticcacaulis sp.]HTM82158.1 cell wall hydrolase [Asticcacaulis sp.]